MLKPLLALAAIVAVLSASGCCLPLHGGRYYGDDRWSDSDRPASPGHRGRPHR